MDKDLLKKIIEKEGHFKFSKSSGPGGQNVNKLNTKVQLDFSIENSSQDKKIKEKILEKLGPEISTTCEELRTRLRNKERAIEKLVQLIIQSIKTKKPRINTKPTPTSIEKRLQDTESK